MDITAEFISSTPVNQLCNLFAAEYAPPHVPSALNAVGACAGFAAQTAVWRELIVPSNRNPGDFLVYVTNRTGEIFFFGDAVNLFLFGALSDRLSFMSLVGRAVTQASDLPNIAELAGHVAKTVGGSEFGRPRLPPSVELTELPRAALARNWGKVAYILRDQQPAEWPVFLAATAFRIIFASKDVAPPLTLKILFEAAVPMSKLNPATVEQSGIPAPSLIGWSQRAMKPENHQQILADVGAAMPKGALPAPQAAPIVIGQPSIAFLNLIGPDTNALAEADRQAIGGPFRQATATAGSPVPKCDILFVYCRLEPTGNVAPYNIPLRDVIGMTGARIAVIASEIPSDLARNPDFQKSLGRGKNAPVNLVLTMNRNGGAFGRFFQSLFQLMSGGLPMPQAWVKLAPQGPNQHTDVPGTLFVMEAGPLVLSLKQ